jgi:hypothetical protein
LNKNPTWNYDERQRCGRRGGPFLRFTKLVMKCSTAGQWFSVTYGDRAMNCNDALFIAIRTRKDMGA